MNASKHRFTVRKQSSGYTASVRFYVYDLVSKSRVTVHAHRCRDTAEMEADRLNIQEMVKPHAEDPRPYEARYAEAEAAYKAGKQERKSPCPVCEKRRVVCPSCGRCDDCGHHPACSNKAWQGKPLIEIL